MSNLETWVHYNPNILSSGRVQHYVNPKLTDEVYYNFIKEKES